MRFATLVLDGRVREFIDQALGAVGIEVLHFAAVSAVISAQRTQGFEAIFVQDSESHVVHWLGVLQAHAAETAALIVIGDGGTSGMSRALLHRADDYIVFGHGAEQLVHRSVARVSARIRRFYGSLLRIGPYTLDCSQGHLSSPVGGVHLPPRELILARVLFESQGRVVPIETLCSDLCGRIDDASKRVLKQHAHVLRKKCREVAVPSEPQLKVEAVYRAGYRLRL